MFVDEAIIDVLAGKGGDGMSTFRTEKYVTFGGPSGGDGGKGGDVIIIATNNCHTLSDYRHKRILKAKPGAMGGRAQMTGRNGEDCVLLVPVGTLVYDTETDVLLVDLVEVGQKYVVCKGGDGGFGNYRYKSATNRAPTKTLPGWPGEEKNIKLELKLIADVALVGYPSVGKSTIISVLSNARPKIGAYPFTTLSPNLGVVPYGNYEDYVIADVPGLIEGAHEGQGLGIQFLKHIERTRVVAHVIEVTVGYPDRDPIKDYLKLMKELESFNAELLNRPAVVILNKSDLLETREAEAELRAYFEKLGLPFIAVSAATRDNIKELQYFLGDAVYQRNQKEDWEK